MRLKSMAPSQYFNGSYKKGTKLQDLNLAPSCQQLTTKLLNDRGFKFCRISQCSRFITDYTFYLEIKTYKLFKVLNPGKKLNFQTIKIIVGYFGKIPIRYFRLVEVKETHTSIKIDISIFRILVQNIFEQQNSLSIVFILEISYSLPINILLLFILKLTFGGKHGLIQKTCKKPVPSWDPRKNRF